MCSNGYLRVSPDAGWATEKSPNIWWVLREVEGLVVVAFHRMVSLKLILSCVAAVGIYWEFGGVDDGDDRDGDFEVGEDIAGDTDAPAPHTMGYISAQLV